jgi:hypothetical protein
MTQFRCLREIARAHCTGRWLNASILVVVLESGRWSSRLFLSLQSRSRFICRETCNRDVRKSSTAFCPTRRCVDASMRTTWEFRTWDMFPETLLKVPPSIWVSLRVKGIVRIVEGKKESKCCARLSQSRRCCGGIRRPSNICQKGNGARGLVQQQHRGLLESVKRLLRLTGTRVEILRLSRGTLDAK